MPYPVSPDIPTDGGLLSIMFDVKDPRFGAKGDGVANDTAAIQSAITACQNAGGGVVFIPHGTYLISAPLVVSADNVTIMGDGWGAQLLAANNWTAGTYLIQVNGPGGAGNFRYGFRLAEIFLNGNNIAGTNGIDMVSAYGAILMHVRCRFITGISVHWDGIGPAFGAYNYMVDCHISDGGATAIGVQTDNSEWLTVLGCNFGFFQGGSGIAVKCQNQNCRFIGTSFDFNDTHIVVAFTNRNIISGCQFDRAFTRCIYLESAKNNMVTGCSFNADSGAGTEVIRADGVNNDRNVITGNSMVGGTTWTNFYAEFAGIGGQNLIANNDIGGLGIVLLTGVARGNRGYNPVGFFGAQPAVPASGTAFVNTLGADATVIIATLGGLTAVKIGATAVTAAPAVGSTYRIPAGQSITLTWATTAPTWQWYGD